MSLLVGLMAAVSAVGVGMAVAAGRRPKPIRVGFDVARVLIGGVAILVMAQATAVVTPPVLAVAAVVLGLAAGRVVGRRIEVSVRGGAAIGRMSPLGIAVWGLALVGMQVAAMGSRVQVFRVGQAVAYFGVALIVGIVVGRSQPIRAARSGRPAGVVAAALAMVVGVSLALADAPASAGSAPGLDEPAAACHVMPQEYRQVLIPEPVPPAFVGCRAFIPELRPVIQLSLYLDASDPLRLFLQLRRLPDTSYQPIDIGDAGELSHSPYDVTVVFVRGPYLVTVSDSDRVEGTVIELAELMDDRIVAHLQEVGFLETEASPPADPGSALSPSASPSDPTTAPDSGDELDPEQVGADDLFPRVPSSGDGWLDGGEITEGEALVSALAGVLAALGMGVIGFAEAGLQLTGVLRRGGRDPGLSEDLLEGMRRSGVVDPDLGDDATGGFEPLESESEFEPLTLESEPSAPDAGADPDPGVKEGPVAVGFEPLEAPVDAGTDDAAPGGAEPTVVPGVAAGAFEPLEVDESGEGVQPTAVDGDVRLSDEEILDAVLSARRGGWSGDELQRYVDGRNASRGGSGTVPIPDLYPLTLGDGTTVVHTGEEMARYRETQQRLAEAEEHDRDLMRSYGELLAEKERWVYLEQQPEWRWAQSIQELHELTLEYDRRMAEAGAEIQRLRRLRRTNPYKWAEETEVPGGGELMEQQRRRYGVTRSDPRTYQLEQEIFRLQSEKMERVQELLGYGEGEYYTPPRDPQRAGAAWRPSLMIEDLDQRLDEVRARRVDFRPYMERLRGEIAELERPDDW